MDDYDNSDHEESYQDEMNNLLSHNTNISFVKKRREYELDYTDMIIMLVFCISLLNDEELIKISVLIRDLRHSIDRKQCKAAIDILIEKKLIEYEFRNGLADTEYCHLTQKAKDEFLDDVEFNEKPKRLGKYFIPAEKIPEKKLFYGDGIKTSIGELAELLREDNFSCIQKRLAESGMRTGFACIFSGPPGTGKTETAYQIARETGRDIMVVDISETKSMWFGESEKRIKEVFNRYRAVVNRGGPAPILLFNEADAILGKRRELSEKREGPGQTENAIQNIILQEMEDLNGILIATTNMTSNLDKAFERRFLYKIEFEKPDSETKKYIWQSLIPELSGGDAVKLAAAFDFSGGQIENIARKSTVSFILKGSSPDFSSLEKFCREELMEKAAVRIGFGA
jgi:SpoVK/Ycf46/Vps4 family AAA+-type ATPase